MEDTLDGQRIAIVGGGLIGLFSAYYLAERGANVVIVERKRLGSGAARGNGGLIVWTECTPLAGPGVLGHTLRTLFSRTSPFFVKPTSLLENAGFLYSFARQCSERAFRQNLARLDFLNRRTEKLYQALKENGVGTRIAPIGILRVFASKEAALADRALLAELAGRGLGPPPGPLMEDGELRAFEPALAGAARAGFVQEGEAFTNPSVTVDELIAAVRAKGVEICEDAAVTDIIEDGRSVRVIAGGRDVRADKCLLAAGAWSRDLARRLGLDLTLVPGKGYSFSVRPAVVPERAIALGDAHAGATPLGGGRLRFAGTMEFDGSYDRFNPRRIAAIKAAAAPYFHGIDWEASEDEWVGPRPMTPDGAPFIGKVPGRERTFIAAGHNMLGLSLGPATGTVVAEMMAGIAEPALLEALSPKR